MALTETQFARAAACEESHQRMTALERMSRGELRALLAGDPASSAMWIRSAAEYGVLAAQLLLGRMLLTGHGTARDEGEACRWFARAAARGNVDGLNMLGRCHEMGFGVPINLEAAADCYRRSAEGGHDWGEYNFGNALFDGRGVACDQRQALHWYVRAACQGHARAMNLAARCLEEGWGCQRNAAEAGYWYRRSAECGYFRGQFNYAALLLEQGDYALAAEWFWKAAHGGDQALRDAISRLLATATDAALRGVVANVARLRPAPA